MMIKNFQYLLVLLLALSGCSTTPTNSNTSLSEKSKAAVYLSPPTNDCEIRKWYNYQVVAIPVINQRWINKGLSLQERAKKAFELRHNARINARFMMSNKAEVKKLQERDQQKYGNPDGPTLADLIKKVKSKGKTGEDVHKAIIQSSSRTSPMYNEKCGIEKK